MESVFYHIREMMEYIRSGDAFSLTWVTADRKRNTGGEIRHLINAVRADVSDGGKERKKGDALELIPALKKKPNHFDNDTINIRKRGTERIVKVHVNLITVFNGKPVID
jgi:hypothetical protein